MASDFDAAAESAKIVKIFVEECAPLTHNLTIERAECGKKLSDEINGLKPDQLRSVGLILERRQTDSTGIEVLMDSDATVSGFIFRGASNWAQGLYARRK